MLHLSVYLYNTINVEFIHTIKYRNLHTKGDHLAASGSGHNVNILCTIKKKQQQCYDYN